MGIESMDTYQSEAGTTLIAPLEQLNFLHKAYARVPQGMTAFQAYHRMTENCQRLSITTSVKTHNAFGRLYMLPVAPAHGVIVRSMLARVGRSVTS